MKGFKQTALAAVVIWGAAIGMGAHDRSPANATPTSSISAKGNS